MKIAFDAKRAFRNYSGLGNYSRMVIRQMAEYYPENEYILFTPKNGNIEHDFPPKNARLELPEGIFMNLFNPYWRSYGIAKELKKEKIDIYHGLSNELPLNIHKTEIKSIVTIHDLIFLRFPHLYKKLDRRIYRKKFRYSAENANLVIAISEQTKSDLINYLNIPKEKILVIYQSGNPIFSNLHENGELKEVKAKYNLPDDYILNVGTIEERKNLLQLIKALHNAKIDAPLIVVGRKKKDYFRKVYQYIVSNNLENIRFLENVPTTDLPLIYQLSRLFVYPSSFEGFGIPVLEASQSGVPVIAGKGHCLEETGGPDSIYVDPDNVEEFSSAIENVLNSEDLQLKMRKSGLNYTQKFHPEKTAKNLYSAYESLYRL